MAVGCVFIFGRENEVIHYGAFLITFLSVMLFATEVRDAIECLSQRPIQPLWVKLQERSLCQFPTIEYFELQMSCFLGLY